ncbi:hypothetical protein DE146DRAFT_38946 [Phaeosphaeria sp. MPI-PUGE-AT-0046c]|nr:hypothetical protein DE146DRAFT_38946 [Phaeosphaeria sp. MPI-PUGE-AT-0046c]
MKSHLTFILAVLCMHAFGAFIWDATNIAKQRASDALHNWHDQRGNDIMCALMSTDLGAGMQLGDTRVPPSARSNYYERRSTGFQWYKVQIKWYWFRIDPHPSACDFDKFGWAPVFNDIEGGVFQDGWKCRRFVHYNPQKPEPIKDQKYHLGIRRDREFRATGAEYNHAHHPDGFVLFQQGMTPLTAASLYWEAGPVQRSKLPELYHQADFAWIDWKGTGPGHYAKNFKYCGVANLSDRITYSLIARFLTERGIYDLEDWPARNSRWSTQTPQGRALLGKSLPWTHLQLALEWQWRSLLTKSASPAAFECVKFILQHKAILDIKYITNIIIFRGPAIRKPGRSPIRYPQLIFEVANVPPNLVKADPAPNWVRPPAQGPRPPISYIPVQINPDFEVPGEPDAPPVVPGPSNPQPLPPPEDQDGWVLRRQAGPDVLYKVSHEGGGGDFVRVHTFQKV